MTKENAKEYLPLVQALADGKTLQFAGLIPGEWVDSDVIKFDRPPACYRIKPEPREFWIVECKETGVTSVFKTREEASECVAHCADLPNTSFKIIHVQEK